MSDDLPIINSQVDQMPADPLDTAEPRAGFDIRVIELPTATATETVDGSVLHGVSSADNKDYQYPFSLLKTFFQSGIVSGVSSVFSRTGDVVAADGDYDLGELGDVTLSSASLNQALLWDGSKWTNMAIPTSAISVDLGYTASASNGVVTNNAGNNATIPVVDGTNAGLMTPTQKNKLDGVESGSQKNVATNLGNTPTANDVKVTSSTGTDTTIAGATTSDAGVMTGAQVTKLNGIEGGAQVNVGTDLTNTPAATSVTVKSSTGGDTAIAGATASVAGVMTAAQVTKLNGIEAGADVNVGTNLGQRDRTTTNLTVTSSTGSDTILPAASTTQAGLLTADDKVRLGAVGQLLLFQGTVDLSSSTVPSPTIGGDRGFTWINDNGGDIGSVKTVSAEWAAVTRNLNAGDKVTPGDYVIWSGDTKNDFVHMVNAVVPTDLGVGNKTDTTFDVTSSTGADATLPAVTTTQAGLMTASDKSKLNGITAGADPFVGTNLSNTPATTSVSVNSSTGTNTSIPAATTALAGVMTKDDKVKLNGIAAGANVNVKADWNATSGDAQILNKPSIPSGATNLSYTKAASSGTVNSSTGTDATIPGATTSDAGLMTAADKTKLNGITAGADPFVGTNLSHTTSTTTVAVNSSTGNNTTLPAATTSAAGVMTKDDKVKLNGIAAGAQVNVGTNLTNSTTTTTVNVNSSTGSDTTLPAATTSKAGVMTSADKTKLNGVPSIEAGTVDGQRLRWNNSAKEWRATDLFY